MDKYLADRIISNNANSQRLIREFIAKQESFQAGYRSILSRVSDIANIWLAMSGRTERVELVGKSDVVLSTSEDAITVGYQPPGSAWCEVTIPFDAYNMSNVDLTDLILHSDDCGITVQMN